MPFFIMAGAYSARPSQENSCCFKGTLITTTNLSLNLNSATVSAGKPTKRHPHTAQVQTKPTSAVAQPSRVALTQPARRLRAAQVPPAFYRHIACVTPSHAKLWELALSPPPPLSIAQAPAEASILTYTNSTTIAIHGLLFTESGDTGSQWESSWRGEGVNAV